MSIEGANLLCHIANTQTIHQAKKGTIEPGQHTWNGSRARLASILSQRHISSPMEPVFDFPRMMNLFPDRNLLPPEAISSVVLWLASDEAQLGDYVTLVESARSAGLGKALTPRSKSNYLTVMRRFFSDVQEIPHQINDRETCCIPRRFNLLRVFETPRSVSRLIGPDPRVINDAGWWKILAAAEALTEADLPRPKNGFLLYPFTMVRALAVTWCYSALRSDEIKRLLVGCIRWQWEQDMQSEDGETVPADATCFLHVPVNKTSTAFWKPVYALVGTCINSTPGKKNAHHNPCPGPENQSAGGFSLFLLKRSHWG